MKNSKNLFISICLVSFSIMFLLNCESENILISNPTFEGEYTLKWSDLPKLSSDSDFKLGGFTSLKYMGDRESVVVTGRGPVINSVDGFTENVNFLASDYTPEVIKIKLTSNNKIKIIDRNPIQTLRGENVSGLPGPGQPSAIVNPLLEPQFWGMNPGGITYNPDGNFYWVVDKYGPSVYQLTGRWGELGEQKGFANIVRRLKPYSGLRKYYLYREGGGGFSGLDIDSKGRLVSIIDKELINYPLSVDSLGNIHVIDTLELYKDRRRLVRFDPNSEMFSKWEQSAIYQVQSSDYDGINPEDVSINGLAIVNDTTCIISEYGESNGNVRNLLVKVVVPDSIWIFPTAEGIFGKSLETLTPHELDSAGLSFAVKREIIDVSDRFDNEVAGITLIGHNKVAILEKQNYGIINGDVQSGTYDIQKEDINIEIIEINTK
jgi:hypothetical protein